MTDDVNDVLAGLGPRLRAMRTQQGTTLAELAEATEISMSTLSRLESGTRKPTLELLLPLARAHRVALDDLVDAPMTGDPRVRMPAFTRHGATFVPLTRRPGGLQAFKQILPPGYPDGDNEPKTHEGYEWLYVLSGKPRLQLGDTALVLTPGEVAEFDTRLPHLVTNPGPEPAEVLNLFGPQGERAHLRALPAGASRSSHH